MGPGSVDAVAEYVVKGMLAAYEELTHLVGKPLPADLVEEALRETLHVAIHELAHAALRTTYPGFEHLIHKGALGECVDEVAARILELMVSNRLGLVAHSIDEHVYELKHYASLANLPISAEDLRELYEEATKFVGAGDVRGAVDSVLSKCSEWISANTQ